MTRQKGDLYYGREQKRNRLSPQRIELEEEAARWGLYGLAVVASHEIITARMERGAERILRLITEGKHDEAVVLMNTETWGVEVEEGQEGAGDGQANPGH